MARADNLTNFLSDVAKSIKNKKEYPEDKTIMAIDFDKEIASIDTVKNQNKTVTDNGTVLPDPGYTGLGQVVVDVPTGIDTSDATAQPEDLLTGQTAYARGEKITGTLEPGVMTQEEYDTCLDLADYIQHEERQPLYTELEYIQSIRTQYIDTGMKINSSLITELTFSSEGYAAYYGGDAGWGTKSYGLQTSWVCFDTAKSISAISYDTIHTSRLSKAGLYLDGAYITSTSSTDFSLPYNIYLFAYTHNGTIDSHAGYTKLYDCKMYYADVLVRHFIPVKKLDSGEVCLYDLVSKQFYLNSGTGEFIAGPEKRR